MVKRVRQVRKEGDHCHSCKLRERRSGGGLEEGEYWLPGRKSMPSTGKKWHQSE